MPVAAAEAPAKAQEAIDKRTDLVDLERKKRQNHRTALRVCTQTAIGAVAGLARVKDAIEAEKLEGHGLRVFVQGGGCSGFQYGLDFDTKPKPGDFEMSFDGLTVYVDPISAMHLEGTTIDYVMGISGAGFKFNNPTAKSTCGCGSSFST